MSRDPSVRVRFCPSPTGNPHVGLVRTCLFNWAYARHHGGTFVFRIEDTDAARDSQESYQQLLDSLRWLGLDWDEGPEVGGDFGPYRQSERRSIYVDVVSKLREAGYLYESFSSGEEIEARHRAAGRDPKLGYDNYDRTMSDAEKDSLRASGRVPVLRFRMPDDSIGWTDLVRGDVTFAPGTVPDYVVVRGNGDPLYPLVNPVDDALMRITHVLRGEDLLPSTPRQIALYRALIDVGVAERVPEFGHLPYVMGEGNKKLSKRDPQANLLHYREQGYLPEGLLNYLALLGWSIAEDRDIFTLREMADAFDVTRVSPNPARFDAKKCEAINGAHLRLLAPDDFAARLVPYLANAGLVAPSPTPSELELLTAAAPLIQERMPVLGQAPGMLGFLFVKDITVDADVQAKVLGADAAPVLDATISALSAVDSWVSESIEGALKSALVDGLGLKPRKAFAPVRAAITGRTVSPPLYESMELLGRDQSLARLRAARELVPAGA